MTDELAVPLLNRANTENDVSVTGLPDHEDFHGITGDYKPDASFRGYRQKKENSELMLVKAIRKPKVNHDRSGAQEQEMHAYWTVSKMDTELLLEKEAIYPKVRNFRVAQAEFLRKEEVVQRFEEKIQLLRNELKELKNVVEACRVECENAGVKNPEQSLEINETVLYSIPAQDGDRSLPTHKFWTRNYEPRGAKPTTSMPIMAFTASSAKKETSVPRAVHTMLKHSSGRDLDCHSARLRAKPLENLELVHNGALVQTFWLGTEACKQEDADILYGIPDAATASKYLQCRLVTLDSHTQSVASVLIGACAFAATCTTSWVQFTQFVSMMEGDLWPLQGDPYARAASVCYASMFAIQVFWVLFNLKDAFNDVGKCSDFVVSPAKKNKQGIVIPRPQVFCLTTVRTYVSAVVIKAFDIPYDIAFAPTRFHYKKVNQPWAQLKSGDCRVCVFGYPVVEFSKAENFGNRTSSQQARLLVSILSSVVQTALFLRRQETLAGSQETSGGSQEISKGALATWIVGVIFSVASMVFSAVSLRKSNKEFKAAKYGAERIIKSDSSKAGAASREAARVMVEMHLD